MKKKNKNNKIDHLLRDLQERAKELNCLYNVEELINKPDLSLGELFKGMAHIMPQGWQYPEFCQVQITYKNQVYMSPGYKETPWKLSSEIIVDGKTYGNITVSYKKETPQTQGGYFLPEESKLINTIADRISHTIQHQELSKVFHEWQEAKKTLSETTKCGWKVIVDLLKETDKKLLIYISQKMLFYLCWHGIEEAKKILQRYEINKKINDIDISDDLNRPIQKQTIKTIMDMNDEVFFIASENLSEAKILSLIQKWIQEDKSQFLVRAVDNPNSSLNDIIDAITRYRHLESEGIELSIPIKVGVEVSLIRRFFSDQLDFINIAKNYIKIQDYYDLFQKIIFPEESQGKLGGKSSGLFLATNVLTKSEEFPELLKTIKIPKTWYMTSDGIINFIYYNNLEEIIEHKYKDLEEIQVEYQNIIQIFKNSHFPPEMVKSFSIALDDFQDRPIIVRSSSLLEDRMGTAFSGKYRSLFLPNQGTKEERLEALTDAIAEVYASTFAPDPIEYRAERGLLDFHEEMGILIQEVVGNKINDYFLPTFAGVAFSNNEFRWSPRINREDGLIRLVPGLGTRAVDRMSDDYPVLLAPGKPKLRVNITPEEVIHYSPRSVDVINLKTKSFETIDLSGLLKEFGNDIPGIHRILSLYEGDHIQQPTSLLNIDFNKDNLAVTFEGLITRTNFVEQIKTILDLLQEKLKTPVDIEFAHDGTNLYLLQCRPQSFSKDTLPSPIPKDLPENEIAFSANRYVSNGFVPDITHIVYIDPEAYNQISDLSSLKKVGRVVGKLNKILPKRQFILMGPGRWGSRGDIKLGVDVTYSDINNTAVLIEIARKKGQYTPDLSFGTHFFQDLVEASIRYLPLYPDEQDVIFNERFFMSSKSIFSDLLPEFTDLSDIIRVIDIPKTSDGLILRVLMNADLDEALGIFVDPVEKVQKPSEVDTPLRESTEDFWRWRLYMVEKMAKQIDPKRFGIKGLYVFGSTKNATAGPGSDIDILVHFIGSKKQREELMHWFEGWSLTLSEMNYLKTGYRTEGLLDIHIITDKDIENKTSFAVKIGAVTDAAKPLSMKD